MTFSSNHWLCLLEMTADWYFASHDCCKLQSLRKLAATCNKMQSLLLGQVEARPRRYVPSLCNYNQQGILIGVRRHQGFDKGPWREFKYPRARLDHNKKYQGHSKTMQPLNFFRARKRHYRDCSLSCTGGYLTYLTILRGF